MDELDWELTRRGHRFARYADDCNIMVKSERAGKGVMASVTRFIEELLRLTVNTRKSAVDRPWKRSFLGFTVSRNEARLKALVCITGFVPSRRRVRGARSEAVGMLPAVTANPMHDPRALARQA